MNHIFEIADSVGFNEQEIQNIILFMKNKKIE
jgi:hypothetical protein